MGGFVKFERKLVGLSKNFNFDHFKQIFQKKIISASNKLSGHQNKSKKFKSNTVIKMFF